MEGTRAEGSGYRLSSVLSTLAPCFTDMEVGDRWSKRELDLRDWASISTFLWGRVCTPSGVTGDDSLPWGKERGGSSAAHTQDFSFFFNLFLLNPHIALPSGGIYWPQTRWRFSPVGEKKGLSPISLESESFITLSRQEGACGEINFTSTAAKSVHVFPRLGTIPVTCINENVLYFLKHNDNLLKLHNCSPFWRAAYCLNQLIENSLFCAKDMAFFF